MMWISFVIILSYLGMVLIRFGIPKSISDTYYLLGKQGWLFQLAMWGTAFAVVPLLIEMSSEGTQFLAFLACAGLAFVGAAPLFKMDLQGKVHYSAAVVCCVSVFAWQVLEGLWDVTLWFVWIGGMLTLLDRSKWCWWLECAAIGSLMANMWRLVL